MTRQTRRLLWAIIVCTVVLVTVFMIAMTFTGCATVSINTGEGGRTSADSGTGPSAPVVSDPAKVGEVTVITDDVNVVDDEGWQQ